MTPRDSDSNSLERLTFLRDHHRMLANSYEEALGDLYRWVLRFDASASELLIERDTENLREALEVEDWEEG